MAGFQIESGKIAVMNQDQVDTDRIIPARFLSMVTRTGYGELAFADVRGPDFPLDQTEAEGASILVVGTNFGCGSSREHAVWAIQQAGFKAVIARKDADSPGYSDIFRSNSANCGLCLIELNAGDHEKLVSLGSGHEVTIDLPAQKVIFGEESASFEMAPATKNQLLKGQDLIGMTLEYSSNIDAYEAEKQLFAPKV